MGESIKRIEIKIPPAKIIIRIGNKKQLDSFCEKNDINEFPEYTHSRSIWLVDANQFILLIRNDLKPKLGIHELVHECKHLTNFVMESRNWKLDFENDEPECYLLEEIFKRIYAIWEKV